MKRQIRILDTTLRDGEQTPGVALGAEEKVEIALALDDVGVDVIEAGSLATSDGERAAIKAVTDLGLNTEISSYSRMRKDDLDLAGDCNIDSVNLVIPSSPLHISTKLKFDISNPAQKEAFFEKVVEVTEYAKDSGLTIEFSCEDASRSSVSFLAELYQKGVEGGADRLCYCDTVGALYPELTKTIFTDLAFRVKAPLSIHCHDDMGLATANTLAAVQAGASCAHLTVNGIGERAGNASLEEVAVALDKFYKFKTGIDSSKLYRLSRLVARVTGVPIARNKSLVGENAFTHEAGIHVRDLIKNSESYEYLRPEIVGRKRRVVLGKHAGLSSIELALKELELTATDEQKREIFRRVKEIGDKGKHVTDADLQSITDTVLDLHHESVIKMKSFTAISGRPVIPTATVILDVNGKEIIQAETGDGPVDAAVKAIQKAIVSIGDIVLEEYHVEAITGGTDALVEVTVRLSGKSDMVISKSTGTDIIEASVEAVINGMNRLL
ncbi:MAG: 2-isopropylmalate synthase [Methanosarcinaceae archaeon]|nr:2-isopropylmalate synthase [Methanosarcinaceae archaeon]